MSQIHVWPDEPKLSSKQYQIGVIVEEQCDSHQLWYQVDENAAGFLADDCDPFVIALMFFAMERRCDLQIHGTVSPSLLRNLAEFQDAWVLRRPGVYHKIDINVEKESERPPLAQEAALVAFSGGLDSTFSAFRHRLDRCGRVRRNIESALMVHGFDIPLDDSDAFSRAFKSAQATLQIIELPLLILKTNHREINPDWDFTHILGVASALSLFKARFSTGILAGTLHYAENDLLWGSSVSTDHLLSSNSFTIFHDGAGFSRLAKIKEVAAYPEAYNALRICYSAERRDENCCKCWSCIANLLRFRVLGLSLPASFPEDVSDEQILAIQVHKDIGVLTLENILQHAREYGHTGSWVKCLEVCISSNKKQLRKPRGIMNARAMVKNLLGKR